MPVFPCCRILIYQAVSLAVSSAQHQNAPPAGTSHPDGGVGVGVGGVSAEDMSSALQHPAAPTGLEQEDPAAVAAEAVRIETPAVATTPSVEVPPADSTKAVKSSEPLPVGIDIDGAALSESKSSGDLLSSSSGVFPVTETEKKNSQDQTTKTMKHGLDSGPWAFAAAAADSEHSGAGRVGASVVRDFRCFCPMPPNVRGV